MTTYSAVVTTGIYCRPGCGARPRAENVRTFELAAAAEAAGFRACLRCRPYRVAGEVPWDAPELVCRAVRLIIGGALDDGTEADLGRRLGMSSRHLRRLFHEHLGLTPDQLARSRRAHFARRMLDDTDLTVADVAYASGFGSLRQFNRTMREVFRDAPQALRERRRRADRLAADGGLALRLPVEPPYDFAATLEFLADRAIPGVEAVEDGTYRRTIMLDGGPGLIEVRRGGHDHLLVRAHLPYWEGLIHVVERIRRTFGLDVDFATADHLAGDPVVGPLLKERPGLRVTGAWGPFEAGVQAIVAQHRDPSDTRAILGRLAQVYGAPIPGLGAALDRAFPAAEVVAAADLPAAGMPAETARTVAVFAAATISRAVRLDGSASLEALVASLTAIPGFGETAAHTFAMRLGERDAFPARDPAVLAVVGPDPAMAEAWRPWRSLAVAHLVTHARPGHPSNRRADDAGPPVQSADLAHTMPDVVITFASSAAKRRLEDNGRIGAMGARHEASDPGPERPMQEN